MKYSLKYQNVKNSGTAGLEDFVYSSPDLPNEIKIKQANVSFKPETISLDKLNITSGKSDISANGSMHNLMGFMFAKQDLKGVFNVNSELFQVNDFMPTTSSAEEEKKTEETTNTPKTTTEEEAMKIPGFMDATFNFNAKKVVYDNLELTNTFRNFALCSQRNRGSIYHKYI